ncbi:MAG: hypothetical protein PHN18_02850 [Sulfurospirillaceae bacterium]|jgi:hypothetical protein|nr:hypothetical protein [Sulfurospirillaceae bacterium]MDD2827834.1 hypothetical protein [Sulfurospirillaceae bacterium]
MTIHEAIVEMRYGGIPEEDIEDILEICKKKGISPQNIDAELEARGFDKVFVYEYDEYESWYEGGSSTQSAHKAPSKETLEKGKK